MKYFPITNIELEELKKKDKKIKELILKYGIIEREIDRNVYSSLVFNIIGQQISTKAAKTIRKRLVDMVGEITPDNISIISDEELKKIGLSYRKVSYIKGITYKIINKELNINKLEKLSDEEIIAELIKLPGIGIWTAEMMLLFTFIRKDVLSYHDLAIRKALKNLYSLDKLTKKDFLKYKESYTPYGSIASLYLWRSTHND